MGAECFKEIKHGFVLKALNDTRFVFPVQSFAGCGITNWTQTCDQGLVELFGVFSFLCKLGSNIN